MIEREQRRENTADDTPNYGPSDSEVEIKKMSDLIQKIDGVDAEAIETNPDPNPNHDPDLETECDASKQHYVGFVA